MLKTILLSPVIIALAFLTALTAYNLMAQLTVLVSRGIGFSVRKLLRLSTEWVLSGAVVGVVAMLCLILFPLLVFVGMLWTRFGGEADFFLTGLSIVIPIWFASRLMLVILTGEPNAALWPLPGEEAGRRGWRRLRRQSSCHPTGVLARRWHTTGAPEGTQCPDGMMFIKIMELKWNKRCGPHIVTSVELVPREYAFGKSKPW